MARRTRRGISSIINRNVAIAIAILVGLVLAVSLIYSYMGAGKSSQLIARGGYIRVVENNGTYTLELHVTVKNFGTNATSAMSAALAINKTYVLTLSPVGDTTLAPGEAKKLTFTAPISADVVNQLNAPAYPAKIVFTDNVISASVDNLMFTG